MILYSEKIKRGEYANVSFYAALEAFFRMGFEIVELSTPAESGEADSPSIFLGGISFMHAALRHLNAAVPDPLDYPPSLTSFLGRKIEASTINEIANDPSRWNVFVKPRGQAKKFTGRLVQGTRDLIGCGDINQDVPVWVSEPVDFVAEWRVFIRYRRVIGVRMYRGDWRAQFNPAIIEAAVAAYEDQPAAYALDFGLTRSGTMLLVEANDGYSLGNYGLFYIDYAKLLSARWAQLTGSDDLCNF